jgi:hypothetical protein
MCSEGVGSADAEIVHHGKDYSWITPGTSGYGTKPNSTGGHGASAFLSGADQTAKASIIDARAAE